MLTTDAVRAALTAADPAGALDRLVREQLAAGRTTGELYRELLPLVRSVREEAGLPADLDETLFGTLDALIGHCNPNECYTDPPKPPPGGGPG